VSINFETCSESTKNINIKIRDPKGGPSTIYFINPHRQQVQKVDVDCLKLNGKSCDYLLLVENYTIEIYIELKGCRVADAFEQLRNTINIISQDSKKMLKYCYIVHTRCPPGTDIQREKVKFKKEYNAVLLTRRLNCEENLKQLLINN
jgi:hypothetical protein